jgi:aerobic-type carbon monoxide dehydrogenase small subunit (CoxS/CutS family)
VSDSSPKSIPPQSVRLTVNGRPEELEASPRQTLLHALREDLHLTGTKEGCGVGTCGACTVLLDGKPVLACLVLAVQAGGRAVETIEALSRDGQLDPMQQAFIKHDAFQCGFCTPGQIMALRGFLRQISSPSPEQIRRALEGNVCRCGAYLRIQAAALELARTAEAGTSPRPRGA